MTHGDAIYILRNSRYTDDSRLEALDCIINDEYESDFTCMTKSAIWYMLKLVYKKYKALLNAST